MPPDIDYDASVERASQVMRERHVDRLTVTAGSVPLGTVSAQDIVTCVIALGLDSSVVTAGDLLTLRP